MRAERRRPRQLGTREPEQQRPGTGRNEEQEAIRNIRSPYAGLLGLAALGGDLMGGTPETFGGVVKAETEEWAKVVDAVGIKLG